MWRCLLVLALTTPVFASDRGGGVVGVGTAFAHDEPGWMVRLESRSDGRKYDDESFVLGGRAGIEVWSAGGSTGINFPIGVAVGGHTDLARATLGTGVGLWAFDFTGKSDEVTGGVAPYVSSAIDIEVGKLLVSIDARVSRQVIGETSDYNVYSVVVMFGGMSRR